MTLAVLYMLKITGLKQIIWNKDYKALETVFWKHPSLAATMYANPIESQQFVEVLIWPVWDTTV